ncbi:MAG: hypothetical protein U0L64_02995, partial [Clostridium sp.]|nr:hypothetical protein [Clostridium sp.]
MRYYNNSMNNPKNEDRLRRRLCRSKMNECNTGNEDEEFFSDDIDENMDCSSKEYYDDEYK